MPSQTEFVDEVVGFFDDILAVYPIDDPKIEDRLRERAERTALSFHRILNSASGVWLRMIQHYVVQKGKVDPEANKHPARFYVWLLLEVPVDPDLRDSVCEAYTKRERIREREKWEATRKRVVSLEAFVLTPGEVFGEMDTTALEALYSNAKINAASSRNAIRKHKRRHDRPRLDPDKKLLRQGRAILVEMASDLPRSARKWLTSAK